MAARIWPASGPPPMASKAMVAPVSIRAAVRSSVNESRLLFTTWVAPIERRRSSCSCLRTMLTSWMPSAMQILLSIWPRFDAAAVWTRAVWPSRRMVSVMPRAVSGLTNIEAPSRGVEPSLSTRALAAGTQRYSAYMAPPRTPTVLPISALASSESPVATTTPPPSLPTGRDCPTRADMAAKTASGRSAVRTGWVSVPDLSSVDRSAPASSRPRSEGLMGDASIRTRTS